MKLNSLSKVIPLHPDEFYFIDHAYSLDILQKAITDHTVITDRHALVQPRLGEYIWALALRMQGHTDVPAYLHEVQFRTSGDEQDGSYWQWQESTTKHFNDSKSHLSVSDGQRIQPIIEARKMATILAVGILCIAFFIGLVMNGWLGGFVVFWILLSNSLFQNSVLRAMGDGPLIVFMLIHFFLSLLYIAIATRWKKLLWIILVGLGITSGLAMSVKLNGVFSAVYFVFFFSIITKKKRLVRNITLWGILLLAVLASSFFVFVLLHPVLWYEPIASATAMIFYRIQLIQLQQSLFFGQAFLSIGARVESVIKNVFFPDAIYGNFSASKYGGPISFDMLFYLVGFAVLAIYVIDYIKTARLRKNTLPMIAFLCWSLVMTVGTTMNLPFDWNRYYLPVVIAASFMQSLGIVAVIKMLLLIINRISMHVQGR